MCCCSCGAIIVRWEQERGSGGSKHTSQEEKERWAGGDALGTARVGRAFDVKGSPQETWDDVFDTVIAELYSLGHYTLQHRRVKTVSPVVTVSRSSTTVAR